MNHDTIAQAFGIIVGNRGFFPDHLAKSGRVQIISILEAAGYQAICLTPEESKHGAVETRQEAKKCADLFRRNKDRISGIIVTLPNFGDERSIAEALRLADLNVPVLIQATPDHSGRMTIADRRDSFCGKMSACNNLQQYGIKYSLTTLHTEAPDSKQFADDLAANFSDTAAAAVLRVRQELSWVGDVLPSIGQKGGEDQ
jgi:L-fucose isomerase-like protein